MVFNNVVQLGMKSLDCRGDNANSDRSPCNRRWNPVEVSVDRIAKPVPRADHVTARCVSLCPSTVPSSDAHPRQRKMNAVVNDSPKCKTEAPPTP